MILCQSIKCDGHSPKNLQTDFSLFMEITENSYSVKAAYFLFVKIKKMCLTTILM